MTRRERRADRLAAYISGQDARAASRDARLWFKTSNESGCVSLPAKGTPRWGGASGSNANGNGYPGSHRHGSVRIA